MNDKTKTKYLLTAHNISKGIDEPDLETVEAAIAQFLCDYCEPKKFLKRIPECHHDKQGSGRGSSQREKKEMITWIRGHLSEKYSRTSLCVEEASQGSP